MPASPRRMRHQGTELILLTPQRNGNRVERAKPGRSDVHYARGPRYSIEKPVCRSWRLSAAILRAVAFLSPLIAFPAIVTPPPAAAQPAPPPAASTRPTGSAIPTELKGKRIEEVRVLGRTRTLSPTIEAEVRNQIRVREGDSLDPATVEEDYQRIFNLRRFGNVEARIEPTTTGVIVIFEITEDNLIRAVQFKGNVNVADDVLRAAAGDLHIGEVVSPAQLAGARDAIERVYRARNYTFAHTEVLPEPLKSGQVVIQITEGPQVYVRNIEVVGNNSYTDGRLTDETHTRTWFPIFHDGTLDLDVVDRDVAGIRRFYEDNGFFDARVGRKLTFNADQTEVQITFVIDEGVRYQIGSVSFRGNSRLSDADLSKNLRQVEGRNYDEEVVRKDIRQLVKDYSPLGFVYYQVPGVPNNPDYLQINRERVFRREAGKVDLVYDIKEGRPFRFGQIFIKGNEKTQDKVILRELRGYSGGLYDSAAVQDATDRLRATNFFSDVRITPIGNADNERDVLIEVTEQSTAKFLIGAGVTSNSGLIGNISVEQRNFDITAFPKSFEDLTNGHAFTGAGQFFRINLEPGTQVTRATIDFVEPWLADQPYSFGVNLFVTARTRETYNEGHAGFRTYIGHRFDRNWSAKLTLRAEDVRIYNVDDQAINEFGVVDDPGRAPEILEAEGHSTIASIGAEVRRDTSNSNILPYDGSIIALGWEHAGLIGEFTFDKFNLSYDLFTLVSEDQLERKTTLRYHADVGYITGGAPFFERYYGGGIGSMRGFAFRGVSPRSGRDDDAVGGDFLVTGGAELNIPLIGETFRGVAFIDAGDVESEVKFGTIRASVGAGIRWTLPLFGQVPLAFDLAYPVSKNDKDDTRFFSFSLGLIQ